MLRASETPAQEIAAASGGTVLPSGVSLWRSRATMFVVYALSALLGGCGNESATAGIGSGSRDAGLDAAADIPETQGELAWLSWLDDDEALWLLPTDAREEPARLAEQVSMPAWSADGQWLSFCTEGRSYAQIIQEESAGKRVELSKGACADSSSAWSPSQPDLLAVQVTETLWAGTPTTLNDNEIAQDTRLARWASTDAKLAYLGLGADSGAERQLFIATVSESTPRVESFGEATEVAPAWSPSDPQLLFARSASVPAVVHDERVIELTSAGSDAQLTGFRWSADGQQFVSRSSGTEDATWGVQLARHELKEGEETNATIEIFARSGDNEQIEWIGWSPGTPFFAYRVTAQDATAAEDDSKIVVVGLEPEQPAAAVTLDGALRAQWSSQGVLAVRFADEIKFFASVEEGLQDITRFRVDRAISPLTGPASFSFDGKFFSFITRGGDLKVLEVKSGGQQAQASPRDNLGETVTFRWAPHAARLAFIYEEGSETTLHVADLPQRLPIDTSAVRLQGIAPSAATDLVWQPAP